MMQHHQSVAKHQQHLLSHVIVVQERSVANTERCSNGNVGDSTAVSQSIQDQSSHCYLQQGYNRCYLPLVY